MKPLVAIIGRPNVGKSTLFNRLVGRPLAIVEDVPGVTRDRQYADGDWMRRVFTVIDTGGFVPGLENDLLAEVREQAQLAVEECDSVLFVVDGKTGPTAADLEVGDYLRRSGKRVLLVANKLDHPRSQDLYAGEFYRLGLGEVFPVSATHALGLEPMLDKLVEPFPVEGDEPEKEQDGAIRLAIVGRPNVGKSTLINSLLRKKRLVADATPGTTRDPIDSELMYQNRRFILTDTAGIRRKATIAQRVEKFAVVASLRVIERSDVAVLLLDALEPAVDQDAKIAAVAEERGRALIICVNKWDQISKDKRKQDEFRDELKYKLKFVAYAPMIFMSALTGSKVEKVLEFAATLYDQFHFRASTPHLNRLLEQIIDSHPAPLARGRPLRLYYIAQVSDAPPSFTITCNYPKAVPDDYKRYLINQLRETFDLKVPLRVWFRERPGHAKRAARKNPNKRKHA